MPTSVPASCDFMVAQPPSYEESMRNYFQNIQPCQNESKTQPKSKSNKNKVCVIL